MLYCFHPQVSLFEVSFTIFSLLWVECHAVKASYVISREVGAVLMSIGIDLYSVLPG
jgi:hypothetical protein